jgi:hypothetical protein
VRIDCVSIHERDPKPWQKDINLIARSTPSVNLIVSHPAIDGLQYVLGLSVIEFNLSVQDYGILIVKLKLQFTSL